MKKRIFNFLHTYRFCFLANLLFVIGYIMTTFAPDITLTESEMFRLGFQEIYLVYGIPLYALIYGICCCAALKRIWAPNIILFFMVLVGIPVVAAILGDGFEFSLAMFLFAAWPTVISLLSSSAVAFIRWVKKEYRKVWVD